MIAHVLVQTRFGTSRNAGRGTANPTDLLFCVPHLLTATAYAYVHAPETMIERGCRINLVGLHRDMLEMQRRHGGIDHPAA